MPEIWKSNSDPPMDSEMFILLMGVYFDVFEAMEVVKTKYKIFGCMDF